MTTFCSTSIEQDLKIDLLDLATDASIQPTLYYKWAAQYAEAHSLKVKVKEFAKVEKIRLKHVFDDIKAKTEADVRDNWELYSQEKKTEGGVQTIVANHPHLKKAQGEYLTRLSLLNQKVVDSTHEDLILEAARDAMLQRQQSIKIAAELYLGGYFSDMGFDRAGLRQSQNLIEKEANQNAQKELKAKLKKRGS